MLVQPTEDEGEVSERPSESQPIPSPTHPSADQPELQPHLSIQRALVEIIEGRKAVKSSKGAPSVQTNTDWDGLDTNLDETINEAMDYTLAQDEGTDKLDEGTSRQVKGTDKQDEGTAEIKDHDSRESATPTSPTTTLTPTPIVFGDDETIAQVLVTMKDITEAEKKFKMLANDEEMARKVQEEWEAEAEKERLDEEEATKVAFTNEYDFIQARLNANKILAEKLQEEEREKFIIEERAKLLHDTIAA
ncbi:hypothetical protein Tco_0363537 [Tanacetum coccineum]